MNQSNVARLHGRKFFMVRRRGICEISDKTKKSSAIFTYANQEKKDPNKVLKLYFLLSTKRDETQNIK